MLRSFHTAVFVGLALIIVTGSRSQVMAQAEKPIPKITPGKVIIPFEKMRRIWGELVSVDLETRTGTFRAESEDRIYHFSVMPYAEMLHHAANGDLADFQIGERAIFRMHVNEADEWYWLTYIQDEMNMLNGHKEYYFVESIDAKTGRIGFTWAKDDKSFIREEGLFLETDDKTQYWKGGQPASFSDIQVGARLRAKTHGIGQGRVRVGWHVFLDDESLLAFREKQVAVHAERMAKDGVPGYVDRVEGRQVELTLFREGADILEPLASARKDTAKPLTAVRIVPAGVSLKAAGDPVSGTLLSCERTRSGFQVVIESDGDLSGFHVSEVARLLIAK